MKALSISVLIAALALLSAAPSVRADDAATPEVSNSDREIIELNKVLVIPQKCTPTDGLMTCDPNANLPANADSSDATGAAADAEPPGDADPATAKAADASLDGGGTAYREGAATANAAPDSNATVATDPDISNPDVPIPTDSNGVSAATAANDPAAISPEYGTLEDYQQTQREVVVVPVPMPVYTGALYGTGPRVYYPSPMGGAYAAARVTTPTYRPPFGAPGPWLSSPAPFGRAPSLSPAPRSLAFHH